MLVQLNEKVFVDPNEVTAIEEQKEYHWPSGTQLKWQGVVVTLKCGRKIYVNDLTPAQIQEKISTGSQSALKEGK